jgi:hypothetical protein
MRWLILLLAACTTFEPVPRETCGNGVLEPGEDCDSSDATCVHCAVTCATAADCPSDAYSCGVDGRCAAPGGALGTPAQAGLFLVDDYRTTDIDGDHIDDVVGVSRTALVVKPGDVGGTLARGETQLTPSQTGPAAFGDLDNDGTLDVTLATADGLVSYGSPFGTLSPLAIQSGISSNGDPVDVRMVFGLGPATIGAFLVDPNTNDVILGVVDFASNTPLLAALPCSPIAAADFSPDLVDVYKVSQDTDLALDAIVAMTSHDGNLCVLDVHKDTIISTPTVTVITPANPPALANKPILADLDGDSDRCPDVIATDGGAHALQHWPAQMASGRCAYGAGAALPSIAQLPASSRPFGHAPFGTAFLGTNEGIVFPDGVWTLEIGGWTQVYASPRPLSMSTTGDVDGDGRPDLVVAGAGSPDVDVLYRTTNGFASYQLFRVPTSAPVTTITLGDFDGNTRKDLAYTERVGAHERMMVAFDSGTRLGAPIEVGTFSGILSVAPAAFPSNADPSFQTSDLIVLQSTSAAPVLTILVGNAQRVLIPYYDPRSGTIANQTVLRTTVVGSFSGAAYPDVIALATPKPNPSNAEVRAWGIPGPITTISDVKTDGTVVSSAVDCSHDFGTGFCAEDASYLAWPASGHDVVIGVDHNDHVARVDPVGSSAGSTMISALTPPMGAAVHQLAAADLDGDGAPELIATFDGAVLVCTVDPSGTPTTCEDASPSGVTCDDATAARITLSDPTTPAPGLDLVAACHDSEGGVLYRIHDGGDLAFTAEELARSAAPLRYVRTGDINGDGLDDVIGIAGDTGAQTLVVFPQCSSRDLSTCGAHP